MWLWVKIKNKIWYLTEQFVIYRKKREEPIGDVWMLHQIGEAVDFELKKEYWISADTFLELLVLAIESKRQFRSIEELEKTDSNSVFITFDDIYEGVYNIAYPILKKYNIPFAVFVTVGYIDQPGYIKKKQLKNLSEESLCTIGGHTISHHKLRELKKKDAKKEIIDGKEKLQQLIGKQINFFAYPYGNIAAVSKRDVGIVQKAKFQYAFSTIQTSLRRTMLKQKFFIPRLNLNEERAKVLMSKLKNNKALKNKFSKESDKNYVVKRF